MSLLPHKKNNMDLINHGEDQASELRNGAHASVNVPRKLRCLAVASGKGGVGKTFVSVGISMALAKMGQKVLLFDADMGLANVDIQVGVDPGFTIQDVIFGNCQMIDAVVSVPNGPDILPSSSGVPELVDLGDARRQMFVQDLIGFASNYHYLVIDVGAGIGKNITSFLTAVPEVLIVLTNEPTSLMDAYSLIKVLRRSSNPPAISLVINMVRSVTEGEQLANRLNDICYRFQGCRFPVAGIVVYDICVSETIRMRKPIADYAPKSAPARCIDETAEFIAKRLGLSGSGRKAETDLFESLMNIGLKENTEKK